MNFNKDDNEIIVKFEAVHDFSIFPSRPIIVGSEGNESGIIKWSIQKVIEGKDNISEWESVIVKGNYNLEVDTSKQYTIMAKQIDDDKYGTQYDLIYISEILDLSNVANQKGFLKTFLKDRQIEEFYKIYDNPLNIIDKGDKDALCKVKGVGDYIATRILRRYREHKDFANVYIQLHELGMTPSFIQKLIKKYGSPEKILDIINNNSYKLSLDIDGIGFVTADNLALKNGIKKTSPKRIAGYIYYYFQTIANSGNSFIYANTLTHNIFEQFGGREEILEVFKDKKGKIIGNNISEAIDSLCKDGILVLEENEDKAKRKVYLSQFYNLEKEIVQHFKRLNEANNKFEFTDWTEIVEKQETLQGWQFTDEQKEGIQLTLENQVTFITGQAGTGKTSVLTGALKALRASTGKYSFAQCALAGQAGARMQEITGFEGYTIHRLLGFNKETRGFMHTDKNPLPYDIVVLDEISLVGGDIFLDLIKAIPTGSKLIILGDMGQLESIGCLNIAKDIYDSPYIKTCELTKIHRQAQKSGIIVASSSIRESINIFNATQTGKHIIGELQDMIFDLHSTRDEIRDTAFNYFKSYYDSEIVKKNIMDIQILCPVKTRGEASVFYMNNLVQEHVNPKKAFSTELTIPLDNTKEFTLRENDKVMNIKNFYNLKNIQGRERTVFNGWIGIVKSIKVNRREAYIYFPMIDDTVIYTYKTLKDAIVLGYASTIHKYQGSSNKVIIGILDNTTPPDMRTKELVYTLLTRAEDMCVLVCQSKALHEATKKSGITNKNTFMTSMLEDKDIIACETKFEDIEDEDIFDDEYELPW